MPLKLNVMFSFFSYGGNSSFASQHPTIRRWFAHTALKIRANKDERVGELMQMDYSDTPIPMMRNQAVADAKKHGADVLVMVDSDQIPDVELSLDPSAKPFWDSSFDFLFEHWRKGPTCIVAPYTGPPPHENIYVFQWGNKETGTPDHDWTLDQYTREQAAVMMGIQPCAAGPTGFIMFDVRVFDLLGPEYFYYEYEGDGRICPHCRQREPGPRTHKASTEDVTFTRDLALIGQHKLGYSPLFCNWDAWAGHCKVKITGKPRLLTSDALAGAYRKILQGPASDERMVFMGDPLQIDPPHQNNQKEAEKLILH